MPLVRACPRRRQILTESLSYPALSNDGVTAFPQSRASLRDPIVRGWPFGWRVFRDWRNPSERWWR